MIYWIKRISALLGISTFFMLFLIGMVSSHCISWEALAGAFGHALTGGVLFWIIGIVVADILLKGILSDVEVDKQYLLDGGLLQQMQVIKDKNVPGGSASPFSSVQSSNKNDETGKEHHER